MPRPTSTTQYATSPLLNYGVVYSIILDDTHPRYENPSDIGAVVFRKFDDLNTPDEKLPLAYPSNKNYIDLPLKNEKIEIKTIDGGHYYNRYAQDVAGNKNLSNAVNEIMSKFGNVSAERKDIQPRDKAEHYNTVMESQLPRSTSEGQNSINHNGYGGKFRPVNVHHLSLNEGDTLIESRFGQSIRLSAYNNPNKVYTPTIIIRNRESLQTQINSALLGTVTEDINRDGSIIFLGSGEYTLPFIPGTIDDKGNTDFTQRPVSFKPYPNNLQGDQMLLSSGRLILSARSGEMMFYSKGNYGFISDGGMSIDNKAGINVNVGQDIHIVTNDRNVNFVTGNGSIFLGSKNLEPMVKGQKLVELLAELIDQIGSMVFLTPSGPTADGPKNTPEFGKIKSKLNDILSKINQTA